MMSPFLSLLIGIIFKLDDLVQVISRWLFPDVLLNEIIQPHLMDSERIIRMIESTAARINCDQGILAWVSSEVGITRG